jgi:hypothetical protein
MKTTTITLLDAMGQNPYEVIIIDNEDGTTTSMLKSNYDEMIARNEANTL